MNQTKQQTYLDSVEDYIRYRASLERSKFLEKNPEAASYGSGNVLELKMLELFKSNKEFKKRILLEWDLKKDKTRAKHLKSIEHARSLGDAVDNAKKRIETLGGVGSLKLSAISKKGNETLGPEGRSARAALINKTLGPGGRSARSATGRETLGPEGRSEVSRKRAKTLGEEALSEIAKKSAATKKEIYGEDHFTVQSKKYAVPAKKKSDQERIGKRNDIIVKELPKYFTGQMIDKLLEDLNMKPGSKAKLFNKPNIIKKNIKKDYLGHHNIHIHQNLLSSKNNTIEDALKDTHNIIGITPVEAYYEKEILSKIKEKGWFSRKDLCENYTFYGRRKKTPIGYSSLKNALKELVALGYLETTVSTKSTKTGGATLVLYKKIITRIKISRQSNELDFFNRLNEWLDTMPDSGITQEMMNKFMRSDRVRPHLILEKEVLGRTGKPIWKKCTWKKF